MQLTELHNDFDKLQKQFGAKNLNAIYGAGENNSPKICLIFMNPTARNVSAVKEWKGMRAPWLGTKNTWKLLTAVNLLSSKTNKEIQNKTCRDWNPEFSDKIYTEIKNNNCFITNLAKCTQDDAKPLHDNIFEKYLTLMKKEIYILNPKIIITFGNQVSSVLLSQKINVSKCRKQSYNLSIKNKYFKIYPVFYPVGQGMRNMNKAIKDIKCITKTND